jgi:hypothetical protein
MIVCRLLKIMKMVLKIPLFHAKNCLRIFTAAAGFVRRFVNDWPGLIIFNHEEQHTHYNYITTAYLQYNVYYSSIIGCTRCRHGMILKIIHKLSLT